MFHGGSKGALVGKALAKGRACVRDLVTDQAKAAIHKVSKSYIDTMTRWMPSANHSRAARRNGGLCGSTTGCFAPGTFILMANGSSKRIEDIRTGDLVLADDPDDAVPPVAAAVEVQVMNRAQSWVSLGWDTDEDGVEDANVRATTEHPFYTTDRGWLKAEAITSNTLLQDPEGRPVHVTRTESTSHESSSYNLDVGGPNTFFVSTDQKHWVLAHNAEFDVVPYRPLYGEMIDGEKLIRHHGIMSRWLEANHKPLYARSNIVGKDFRCVKIRESLHTPISIEELRRWPTGTDMTKVSFADVEAFCNEQFRRVGMPEGQIKKFWEASVVWSHKWGINLCGRP